MAGLATLTPIGCPSTPARRARRRSGRRSGREEVGLPVALAQARGDRLELAEAEQNAARLGAFVRSDDLELLELLHDAHRARMADGESRLQLRRRREVRFDDEFRGLVRQRIEIAALLVVPHGNDL